MINTKSLEMSRGANRGECHRSSLSFVHDGITKIAVGLAWETWYDVTFIDIDIEDPN